MQKTPSRNLAIKALIVDGKSCTSTKINLEGLYSDIFLICFILRTTQTLKIVHNLHVKETLKTLGMGNVGPSQDTCT